MSAPLVMSRLVSLTVARSSLRIRNRKVLSQAVIPVLSHAFDAYIDAATVENPFETQLVVALLLSAPALVKDAPTP